ncbi:sugar kinase [Streptomyces sp. NPDC050560]|uniref:sugar kinase n=1 Tax=Streptomyces sp. NPDC050560 TaxID=3365630 RepID=UPI0037AFBB21
MNTAEQAAPVTQQDPEPPAAEGRRHKIRRRTLTLVIIVLLIGVPAGYLVISANQSRDSGKDKEDRYSATGMSAGSPTRVQRRLYNIPVPREHAAISSYETNNWKTSRLYVQFLTTNKGLASFLHFMGAGVDDLKPGKLPVTARDRKIAHWDFSGTGEWSGLVHSKPDPQPTQTVVVNRANPKYPQVYVVSETTP